MYQHTPSALSACVDTMGTMTDVDPDVSPAGSDAPRREDDGAPGAPTRWARAADLFEQWRAGRTRAMDDLVRLMTPVLWQVVRAYGLDRALAEDVVQSTWLVLVRNHASIAEPRAISGWLTTTARREAWRVGKAHRRSDATEAEHLEPHLPTHESAEQTAQQDDRDGRLWRAVATLDDRCRRLIRVVAFDDRPDYARIAQDLAMPIGSIGPTRQRCLGKLRVALEGAGWGRDDE